MTGIFRGDIGGIEPSVIELYALDDIPDLSVYGIEIARDGSEADGVEYNLSSVSLDSGQFFTISSNNLYYKSEITYTNFETYTANGTAGNKVEADLEDLAARISVGYKF